MRKKKRGPKIGLVLSSGTARGFAHVGVLKVLEENGIKVDAIAGVSAGAVVGALYCCGMNADSIKRAFLLVDWEEMFEFGVPKSGLIKGDKYERFLELLTQNRDFKDLQIPLFVVATNITKKEKAVFHQGNVAKALRASSAIPGIFEPVCIDGDDYVDGGVVDPAPVAILKEHGMDVIIAVDISSSTKVQKVSGEKVKAREDFLDIMKEKMVVSEVALFKEFLKAKELAKGFVPKVLRRFVGKIKYWLIDRFIKPAFAFKWLGRSKTPKILTILYDSMAVMQNEFLKARFDDPRIDVVISPVFRKAGWTDFDKGKYFVARGAQSARAKIKEIKRVIRVREKRF